MVKRCRLVGLEGSVDPDSPQDITFQTIDGLIGVRDVAADGLFSESPISEGGVCLSLDGVPDLSADVVARALRRSQSTVVTLVFSLTSLWMNVGDFIIDEKFDRWWKRDSACTLLRRDGDRAPITLSFDERTRLFEARGNEGN